MISIAHWGTLKGGAPDSKLALKASSRSCSFMSPPRVTAEALVSKVASAGLGRDEPGQALRDDLARFCDQLTNNLTGRLDLVNQEYFHVEAEGRDPQRLFGPDDGGLQW